MAVMFGKAVGGGMERLVSWVIVPVASVIPVLVRTGLLFLGFAVLWAGFFVALVGDPTVLASVRETVFGLPLILQAMAWLLFLPLMGGLWAWGMDWPLVVRLVAVIGIAGWNLIIFVPRHDAAVPETPATPAEASEA